MPVVAAAMRWWRWKNDKGAEAIKQAMCEKELIKLAKACRRLSNLKAKK